MSKHFIFCHGFGFDRSFWDNLVPYFAKEYCTFLDLGYFGNKCETIKSIDNAITIGIGHSLGLCKLLNLNQKFDYLIGLNSFINFLGNVSGLYQKRKDELEFLKQQLKKSPMVTMNVFYQTCGVANNKIEGIDTEIALNDLDFLAYSFNLPQNAKTLIIGAKDDVIVPPEILYDNFNCCSNATIDILDKGKHALGYLEAQSVKDKIFEFIN